jgi:hypothetical protein
MGDSLNRRTYAYFELATKIENALKALNPSLCYNITYFETSVDGSEIYDILTQQVPLVCAKAAQGFNFSTILMFWDSGIITFIHES